MGSPPCFSAPAIAEAAAIYARTANGNHYFAQFIQDDIKWTSKLTINIGFRLEEETGTTERYNRMAAINPSVLNPISNQVTNPFTGQTPWNLYGGYVFAGSGADSLGSNAIREHRVEAGPADRNRLCPKRQDGYPGRLRHFLRCALRGSHEGIHQQRLQQHLHTWVATLDNVHPTNLFSNPFPIGLCLSARQLPRLAFRGRPEPGQRLPSTSKHFTTNSGIFRFSAASVLT